MSSPRVKVLLQYVKASYPEAWADVQVAYDKNYGAWNVCSKTGFVEYVSVLTERGIWPEDFGTGTEICTWVKSLLDKQWQNVYADLVLFIGVVVFLSMSWTCGSEKFAFDGKLRVLILLFTVNLAAQILTLLIALRVNSVRGILAILDPNDFELWTPARYSVEQSQIFATLENICYTVMMVIFVMEYVQLAAKTVSGIQESVYSKFIKSLVLYLVVLLELAKAAIMSHDAIQHVVTGTGTTVWYKYFIIMSWTSLLLFMSVLLFVSLIVILIRTKSSLDWRVVSIHLSMVFFAILSQTMYFACQYDNQVLQYKLLSDTAKRNTYNLVAFYGVLFNKCFLALFLGVIVINSRFQAKIAADTQSIFQSAVILSLAELADIEFETIEQNPTNEPKYKVNMTASSSSQSSQDEPYVSEDLLEAKKGSMIDMSGI